MVLKTIFKKTIILFLDFRAAFNIYDREGKGEIPTSLLGTVMKNLGHNLKQEQLQECIEAVDGDGMLFAISYK